MATSCLVPALLAVDGVSSHAPASNHFRPFTQLSTSLFQMIPCSSSSHLIWTSGHVVSLCLSAPKPRTWRYIPSCFRPQSLPSLFTNLRLGR